MRVYRGRWGAALALALVAACAWATDEIAPIGAGNNVTAAEQAQRLRGLLDRAFGPAAAADQTGADSALEALVGDPAFAQLPQSAHASVYSLAGDAALEREQYPQARDWYLRAITANSTDSDDWANLSWAEYKLQEHDAAGAHMAELARRWPGALDELHESFLYGLVDALRTDAPVRLDLLQSMASAGWKQSGAGADLLWFELALLRAQRGERELARAAIDRVAAPYELIQLRSDRRFDGLYDPQSPRFDVALAARQRVERLAALSAAAPHDLELVHDVTTALQVVGEFARIVELVDATLQRDPKDFSNPELKVWLLNGKASALDRLGRWEDALATMRLASTLSEEGEANVSQAINLGDMYCARGDGAQALAAVAEVGDMSTYGEMALQSVLHCARLLQGDRGGAAQALAYLQNPSLSAALHLSALLREGRMDAAAEALIAALASETERAAVLVMVQDYLPSALLPAEQASNARWDALVRREDVRVAIERVGRRQRYEIHQP